MAVIIYAILFIPAGWVAVAVCFLMCFPIVYTNILAGLDAMPREFIELARVYELTKSQTIRYVYAPGISAQIKSAVRLIAGLSWKAVVAAEVLSIPRYSLGYEMMNAKYYLDTENLFAYIAVIVGLSLAIEKLIDKWILKGATSAYEGSKLFAGSGEKVAETKFSEAPTIVVQDLSKTYGDNQVLVSLNMEFEGGRGTAVTAPSGRGKTTLARIIAGLEKADSGSVEASGPVKLSYLFQEDRLFPWLNIYDNMAIGLLREGQCDEKRIEKMAKALEIEDALWKLPEELSGGMKHRAAMGRTFWRNPM